MSETMDATNSHDLAHRFSLLSLGATMSHATTNDSEPVVNTSNHEKPPPLSFLLTPRVWSMCQLRPFRFLDLPPELRNAIYEQAFTGYHGLSPHHLTQVNRHVAAESTQMFRAKTHTLQISLQTPAHMTRFLDWLTNGADLTQPDLAYEITFTDIDVGITTVRFTQGLCYPSEGCEIVRALQPELSDDDVILSTWHHVMGVQYLRLMEDFGELFMWDSPPSGFIEAVDNGYAWLCQRMEFAGESEPSFPATSIHAKRFFLHFIRLMTVLADKELDAKDMRHIANFLFMRIMQAAGKKAKR